MGVTYRDGGVRGGDGLVHGVTELPASHIWKSLFVDLSERQNRPRAAPLASAKTIPCCHVRGAAVPPGWGGMSSAVAGGSPGHSWGRATGACGPPLQLLRASVSPPVREEMSSPGVGRAQWYQEMAPSSQSGCPAPCQWAAVALALLREVFAL